jgi:hypothetical protein
MDAVAFSIRVAAPPPSVAQCARYRGAWGGGGGGASISSARGGEGALVVVGGREDEFISMKLQSRATTPSCSSTTFPPSDATNVTVSFGTVRCTVPCNTRPFGVKVLPDMDSSLVLWWVNVYVCGALPGFNPASSVHVPERSLHACGVTSNPNARTNGATILTTVGRLQILCQAKPGQ